MAEQAPNMTKDYASTSLDEYIRDKASEFKNLKRKRKGVFKVKTSQQWRLGRNGPRCLKRLVRYGPLRAVNLREPFQGLPKLVVKRYAQLPRTSVFHRLGWNPLFTVARQKVRQATECLWRRQFNFVPRRHMMSHPMAKRPMFFPNCLQNMWGQRNYFWGRQNYFWRRQNYYRPCRPNYSCPNFQTHISRNDDLIQADRLRIAQGALHKLQKTYKQGQPTQQTVYQADSEQYNQAGHNPFLQQESQHSDLPGSSKALAALYPIAKDTYMPLDNKVRPPSPEGSIISIYHRHGNQFSFANNPFAKGNNLKQGALHKLQKTYNQEQRTQQTFYQAESEQYNQAGHNPFLQQESQHSDLPGSSKALAALDPIAKDTYMPLDNKVRPPSPVGSIISMYGRHPNTNHFSTANNPVASRNNLIQQSASQQLQQGRNPFVTNSGSGISFRPTPNVTHIPITQRFAAGRS